MIRINEVFGPTIQGEGPNTGRHCLFVRVSRCNLHCAWCDTPYTWAYTPNKAAQHNTGHLWDPNAEEHELTTDQVIERLMAVWDIYAKPTLIVISGGEPLLQQKELSELVSILLEANCDVEFETAGTIAPVVGEFVGTRVHYDVSPKLAHSGNNLIARRNFEALKKLATLDSDFKFVLSDVSQFEEADFLVVESGIPRERVWAMPEGVTTEAVKEHGLVIVDEVMKRGWNLSLRNHIWLWAEERGK